MRLVHIVSMSAMRINSKHHSKARVRTINKSLKETMSRCPSVHEPSRAPECKANWEHIESIIDGLQDTEARESRERKKRRPSGDD